MLADILAILWMIMSGAFGWFRGPYLEIKALIIWSGSFILSRTFSSIAQLPLVKEKPVLSETLVTLIILIPTYLVLNWLSGKWSDLLRPQEGIKIKVDEEGNIKVSKIKLLVLQFAGFIAGTIKGLVTFSIFIWFLLLTVPSILYEKNRKITVVHPNSKIIQFLRNYEPLLKKIDNTAQGLITVYNLKKRYKSIRIFLSKCKKKSFLKKNIPKKYKAIRLTQAICKEKELLKKLSNKKFLSIWKNKRILKLAASKRLGKRDPTLLLSQSLFQKILYQKELTKIFDKLASINKNY